MGADNPATIDRIPATPEVVDYCNKRIAEFENERKAWLEAIDKCSVQHVEVHNLEWENRKRIEEIRQLQKALSDAHAFLFEERQRLLALQAENDDLRLREMHDKQKLQQLLPMTTEQEIIYQRHGPPETIPSHPKRSNSPGRQGFVGCAGGGGERIMRTVFLPTANADMLSLKVESLQAQLNEQKQLANERIQALLDDRRLREKDAEGHALALEGKLDELTKKLAKSEEALRQMTKEYINARGAKQEAQAQAVTIAAKLEQQKAQLKQKLDDTKRVADQQLKHAQQQADDKLETYGDEFRQQIKTKEQELNSLNTIHATVKAQLENRIADLENALVKMKDTNKQLERRRQQDVEGWTADITFLRKKLNAVERKLHQIRLMWRLEDDDRLESLLSFLEKKAPDVRPPGSRSKSNCRSRSSGKQRKYGVRHPGSPGSTFSDDMVVELEGIKKGLNKLALRVTETRNPPTLRTRTPS